MNETTNMQTPFADKGERLIAVDVPEEARRSHLSDILCEPGHMMRGTGITATEVTGLALRSVSDDRGKER